MRPRGFGLKFIGLAVWLGIVALALGDITLQFDDVYSPHQERIAQLLHGSALPEGFSDLKISLAVSEDIPCDTFAVRTHGLAEGVASYAIFSGPACSLRSSVPIAGLHGLYRLLHSFGFFFPHPLDLVTPDAMNLTAYHEDFASCKPVRSYHFHTMHPLEYTPMLQGFSSSQAIGTFSEFQSYVDEQWPAYCQWLVANMQNHVSWVLLYAEKYRSFADSFDRRDRLLLLTSVAQQFGLLVGIDVPVALQQQHAWRLVRNPFSSVNQAVQELVPRVDYLMSAGFDFIETEMGTSEFTSTGDVLMVGILNATVAYVEDHYQGHVWVKIHCSTGQVARSYGNMNYNFIAQFADPRLVLLPHTVQIYSLTDPAYGTYGNTNFSAMLGFMQQQSGIHPMVFYPETAYWVNYDISGGLFLPIYADRRMEDLRIIDRNNIFIDGVHMFHSGFEYAYWLNDIVSMHAATGDGWELVENILGRETGVGLVLKKWLEAQLQFLIRQNGQAYLAGDDTWSEIGALARTFEQPPKVTVYDLFFKEGSRQLYASVLRPLLSNMSDTFASLDAQFSNICRKFQGRQYRFLQEVCDAVQMTSLRSQIVFSVYEMFFQRKWSSGSVCSLIRAANDTVTRRSQSYRLPAQQLSGWLGSSPTCYRQGYLWTADQLFYSWRDLRRAFHVLHRKDLMWLSPCKMNFIDPGQVSGIGEGVGGQILSQLRKILDAFSWTATVGECLAAPTSAPAVADWSICTPAS